MKRTPLKRKTPLRRVNHKRKKKLKEAQFGDHADYVRAQGCVAGPNGCEGSICAAHVVSRGAGGTARDLAPLCWRHHTLQHQIGILTFERRYGLDLKAEAERLWEENGSDDG